MQQVSIYTDGACSGNPGAGGWAAVLRCGDHRKEIAGGAANTTNNRMELSAVIAGLSALKTPCIVSLYSDSKYIVDAVNLGWLQKWASNGWMRNRREKALNQDLWEKLLPLLERHQVTFIWVKGHAGNPENERCDALAVAQSMCYQKDCG